MPPQPKTAQLPAADPVQVLLLQMQRSMDAGFREMGTDIKLVSNDLGIVKDRLVIVETWKNDQDSRMSRTSARVQQASEMDLAHEARLAAEIVARQELATKLDALTESQAVQLAVLARLDKIATNPHIKLILAVLATAAMSWAASKGLK